MDGLAHAVAQGAAQSAREPRQGRQLDLFPPAGTGGVDFEDLGQFAAGFAGRLLPRNDDELHPPLGDGPLPMQRLAQGPRPAAALLGRDHDVIDAFLFRQGKFQRNGFPAAADVLLAGPQGPLLGVEQLGLDLHVGVGRHGQEVRDDFESHGLAGREDHRRAGHADEQRIARRAADEEAILAVVERQVAELAGDIGEGDFDLRPGPRIAGGGELDDELGLGRGGDNDIDAVVGPRRALADDQPAVFQPHRAGLVGLDPQRARLGNGPAADGDGAFPQFFCSAAPGDANHDGVVGVRERAHDEQQEKNHGDVPIFRELGRASARVGRVSARKRGAGSRGPRGLIEKARRHDAGGDNRRISSSRRRGRKFGSPTAGPFRKVRSRDSYHTAMLADVPVRPSAAQSVRERDPVFYRETRSGIIDESRPALPCRIGKFGNSRKLFWSERMPPVRLGGVISREEHRGHKED